MLRRWRITKKFDPNQPRVPKGLPGAGRWLGRGKLFDMPASKPQKSKVPATPSRTVGTGTVAPGSIVSISAGFSKGKDYGSTDFFYGDIEWTRSTESDVEDRLHAAYEEWSLWEGNWRMRLASASLMDLPLPAAGGSHEIDEREQLAFLTGNPGAPDWAEENLRVGVENAADTLTYIASSQQIADTHPELDYLARGLVVSPDDPLLTISPGVEFDMPLTAFTPQKSTAKGFAAMSYADKDSGWQSVLFMLDTVGAHGMPSTEEWDEEFRMDDGHIVRAPIEFVTAGRYKVATVERESDGTLVVWLDQTAVFEPGFMGRWREVEKSSVGVPDWVWSLGGSFRPAKKPQSKIERALTGQYLTGYRDGLADPLVKVSKAAVDPDDILTEAQDYARQRAGDLIVGVKNTRIIQSIVSRAIAEDWPDDRLQAAIGRSVGLDPRSQTALNNYEKGLVERGTPPGTRRRLVKAYSDTLKARRVKLIANNERAMAYAEGKRAVWRQMKSMGEISPYAVRVWRTHKDERTCEVCGPLNGRRASMDEGRGYKAGPPSNPTGFTLGPPAHVNCRCWEELDDKGTPEIP